MIIWQEKPDGSDDGKHLTKYMQVTRKCNLKLNIDKFQYKTKHTSLFGTTLTSDGHKLENEKVRPLTKCHNQQMAKTSSVSWVWSITWVLFQIGRTWQQLDTAHQEKCTIYMGTWTYWRSWCHQKRNLQWTHTQIYDSKISHSANRYKHDRSWCSISQRRPPSILCP